MTNELSWTAANGEKVTIGDYVALAINRDSVGRIIAQADDHTGRPLILLTEGHGTGDRRPVDADQMLLRVLR